MATVPLSRITRCNEQNVYPDGDFVLYWMIAARRTTWNFGLQRAVEHCVELGKPLLILEALRTGYQWASDRLHAFIMEGMKDNARRLEKSRAAYYPYLEPEHGHGRSLLKTLSEKACVIVTDDFPCFFLPRMVAAAAELVAVRLEKVDSNGLLPMAEADRTIPTAYSFRRFLQKNLPEHFDEFPDADPLKALSGSAMLTLDESLTSRWPPAFDILETGDRPDPWPFPIDRDVAVAQVLGGTTAAEQRFDQFLQHDLDGYADNVSHPDDDAGSGLSPYLHFGHISVHQVFYELMTREAWTEDRIASEAKGKRSGWWGVSESAESFLDELITWRELGYNMCSRESHYDRYSSLPDWARETIEDHLLDEREYLYTPDEFEQAQTHDNVWNAAQRQLVTEGRLHNYLRMLWGKKIFEWSATPQDALEIMIHLNNKYALDGRDPNSYSGIFWILGRYDRAWGPERPIYGKIRYMSSENTVKKLRVKRYLEKYGP